MATQNKITGVILAGGRARRMGNIDKGLIEYRQKPMISYALSAMTAVAEEVFINANRNIEQYRSFGFDVIADQNDQFDGPLAGILSGMMAAKTDVVCVMPCDSPLITKQHLQQLIDALFTHSVDIAVAFDGERLHPVFLALKRSLLSSLQAYLNQGDRKIDLWLRKHELIKVDFSQQSDVFLNINTLDELKALEKQFNG